MFCFFFFFKQKTAYEISACLVGSEMCIRDRLPGYLMEKKRVKLVVAYDGTDYHGWQVQDNGITVAGELNRCLTDLLQEKIEVMGASPP